jgi:hypothetical protein
LGFSPDPIFESNREGVTPNDNSAAPLKEQTGAFLRTRHQRILFFVQNKNSHNDSLSKRCPYGPCNGGIRPAPLANVCNRLLPKAADKTFGALPFASMIKSFQRPELRKHPGVGLNDLLQT